MRRVADGGGHPVERTEYPADLACRIAYGLNQFGQAWRSDESNSMMECQGRSGTSSRGGDAKACCKRTGRTGRTERQTWPDVQMIQHLVERQMSFTYTALDQEGPCLLLLSTTRLILILTPLCFRSDILRDSR
jgi:hypothetical protein